MQRFIAIVTALFLMVSSFFVALPHTFMLDSKTPETTVTDKAQVLKLYKQAAKDNEDLRLRKKITPDPFLEASGLLGTVVHGLPGNPGAIKKSDLRSAKAEYYEGGKTLVITLEPKLETFSSKDKVIAPITARTMDNSVIVFLAGLSELSGLEGEIRQASIEIVVDTNSGKVVAAQCTIEIYMQVVIDLPDAEPVSADAIIKEEIKLP